MRINAWIFRACGGLAISLACFACGKADQSGEGALAFLLNLAPTPEQELAEHAASLRDSASSDLAPGIGPARSSCGGGTYYCGCSIFSLTTGNFIDGDNLSESKCEEVGGLDGVPGWITEVKCCVCNGPPCLIAPIAPSLSL